MLFRSVSSTEQRFAVDLHRALSGFGGLFVCSAGNLGQEVGAAGVFPANFGLDNQITVAACDEKGALLEFSNYSKQLVEVAAPGRGGFWPMPLYVNPNGGKYCGGTSIAAPTIAGLAAKAWDKEPSLCAAELKTRILQSAKIYPELLKKVAKGSAVGICGKV